MKFAAMRRRGAARPIGCLVSLALLVALPGVPLGWAQQRATITGVLLDPQGAPQSGCQIVIRDITSGAEYRSGRTGADGVYAIDVPVGSRFAFVSVVDPAGEPHTLDIPPLAVTLPATLTRNIRIVPAPAPASSSQARSAAAEPDARKSWWRKNGKWVGIGVGVLLLGLAGGGGGDDDSVSPSEP